jgi:hypothetical protein
VLKRAENVQRPKHRTTATYGARVAVVAALPQTAEGIAA